jgi:hypothetical protein
MSKMFGERIHQFVLSCDIMNRELFHDILKLITSYLKDELKIRRLTLLGQGKVDGRPGLKTIWNSSDDTPSYTIKRHTANNNYKYTSFCGYSFDRNLPLWMLDTSRPSHAGSKYEDFWPKPGSKGRKAFILEKGVFENQDKSQTFVIHPITADGQVTGVIEFCMEEPLVPKAATRKEIELLADIISRAQRMNAVRRANRSHTKNAIEMLEESRKKETWSHLGRPKLFFAFSGGTKLEPELQENHKIITDSINAVLDDFKDAFEITRWDNMDSREILPLS